VSNRQRNHDRRKKTAFRDKYLLNEMLTPRPKWRRPNTQKHGAFAENPIILNENQFEFERLFSDLIDEWQPSGPTEDEAVFSLASDMWRKQRVQRALQAKLAYRTFFEPDCPVFDEMDGLMRFCSAVRAEPETAFEKHASCCLKADKIKHLKEKVPRSGYASASEWAEAIVVEIFVKLVPQAIDLTVPEFKDPSAADRVDGDGTAA
jgi:hypothetical protein